MVANGFCLRWIPSWFVFPSVKNCRNADFRYSFQSIWIKFGILLQPIGGQKNFVNFSPPSNFRGWKSKILLFSLKSISSYNFHQIFFKLGRHVVQLNCQKLISQFFDIPIFSWKKQTTILVLWILTRCQLHKATFLIFLASKSIVNYLLLILYKN